jgi:hypothetical protein
MAKPIRTPQVGRDNHTNIPAEYVEEAAIVPSPTAVAAEALATGVVPLESQHAHPADKEIPGDEEALRAGDPDNSAIDNAFVGDETPVGDMSSPDHNQVDDIGRAMGVQEEDSGELRTSSEIMARRDQARGYLDEGPDPDTRRR